MGIAKSSQKQPLRDGEEKDRKIAKGGFSRDLLQRVEKSLPFSPSVRSSPVETTPQTGFRFSDIFFEALFFFFLFFDPLFFPDG